MSSSLALVQSTETHNDTMWGNIPGELRALVRWVCWRHEQRDTPKPTKVPIHPRTQYRVSITDIANCSTFDDCVLCVQAHKADGVGFCLFTEDGYVVIDLDQSNDAETIKRQTLVHERFASYSEKSPSGTGLHIVIRGQIPMGCRRGSIEIYGNERFITFTGNVYSDLPIENRNELINILYNEMNVDRHGKRVVFEGGPEVADDQTIIQKGIAAPSNGPLFEQLFKGDWAASGTYPSQSEADLAFINMIAHYTDNKAQIKRIFLQSGLGWRQKAKRDNYVNPMIEAAFDRRLGPIDFSGLTGWRKKNAAEAASSEPDGEETEPADDDLPVAKTDVNRPPGMIGLIAEYVYFQSMRPVTQISLISAITMFAGIVGRQYNTPTDAGLNLYSVLLARSSTGKEAMNHGITKLFSAIRDKVPASQDFLGAASIASGPALIRMVEKKLCSVSVLGEFAHLMTQLCCRNIAPHMIALRAAFLQLYSKSGRGSVYLPSVYSEKDKNIDAIYEPAFSFLGECTPDLFYETLGEDQISSGFLTRMFVVEYFGERVRANKHVQPEPSPVLVQQLCDLFSAVLTLQREKRIVKVVWGDGVEILSDKFDRYCDDNINSADKEVTRELFGRCHLNAMKIASLFAVAENVYFPIISKQNWQMAEDLIRNAVNNIVNKFKRGETGKKADIIIARKIVEKEIKTYLKKFIIPKKTSPSYGIDDQMIGHSIMPFSFLSAKCASRPEFNPERGLKGSQFLRIIIKDMCDDGILQELTPQQRQWFQTSRALYQIKKMPDAQT